MYEKYETIKSRIIYGKIYKLELGASFYLLGNPNKKNTTLKTGTIIIPIKNYGGVESFFICVLLANGNYDLLDISLDCLYGNPIHETDNL